MGPLLLGVEIGGTKLQLGLGPGDGTFVAFRRLKIDPERGAQGILAQIRDVLPEIVGNSGTGDVRPVAAGVGFGGPVDSARGVVIRSHQVEGWDGFDLAGWVRSELGICRVAVENDADVAGLGEARFGAGLGLSPIFYVTVGSGIGGGLILDGRIYRGAGLGASEIGHLWVDADDSTPRRLEEVASGWSIGSRARELGGLSGRVVGEVDAQDVASEAAIGNPVALEILRRSTRAMGRALAQVVTLLAPRSVILGGGVSLIEDHLWLDPIRSEIRNHAFPPFMNAIDIVKAKLGQDVVIHGALALAADQIAGDL